MNGLKPIKDTLPVHEPDRNIQDALKITIISPSFGRFGGLESFVLTLTRGLVDAGQQVETLFKQTKDFKLGGDLSEAVKSSGLDARFCRRAGADLFRGIARSDVVHVQNPCPDVILMARALGKPVLINVINHSRGHGSARERLWHQCLKRGNRRFYISEFVRKSWEGPDRWPGSEVVFPVCALPEMTSPIPGRAGFCFVSRLIPNKGLEELLPAYAAAG
ncbi:MAG TPA: glycosyltransferase, partial [Roseimicrobium sp.]|nr:glycosyltransferase [Roseimicrobium sp.]